MPVIAIRKPRPGRSDIEPAALDLVRRYGAQIMGTARRYSATPEDAEDAYQRGLEILLTKAPSTSAEDLVPWLKTVVKHEAFALRKQRERHGAPTEPEQLEPAAGHGSGTDEQLERMERLQLGAEAMRRLKPQEVRCLLLLAEGYSYKQIQEITGWTYTKVNRCLTEGRRSFVQRVDRIESGAECERLAPLLSALADGEATAEDMAALRPHLRSCLSCRASLREHRQAPARVAALVPAGVFGSGDAARSLLGWLQERLVSIGVRAQNAFEMASAHKAAAVAASAAVAGSGVATVETIESRDGAPARAAVVRHDRAGSQRALVALPVTRRRSTRRDTRRPRAGAVPSPSPTPPRPQVAAEPIATAPSSGEFTPQPADTSSRSRRSKRASQSTTTTPGGEFGP
jgi:RNA polymerase sigma factor (sigma-70 family)